MVAQFDWIWILIAIPVGMGEVVDVGYEPIVVLLVVLDGRSVVIVVVVVVAVVALVVLVLLLLLLIVSGGGGFGCRWSPTEEAERAQGWEIQGEEHEEQGEDGQKRARCDGD